MLKETIDKYYSESPKMEDAIASSKEKLLKETLLQFSRQLEDRLDKITYEFIEANIDTVDKRIIKKKNYYTPLYLYAVDMLPPKGTKNKDDPDCRELITEFLEKKSSKGKFICEKWLNENNFDYKLDDDEANDDEKFQFNQIENHSKKRKASKSRNAKKKKKKTFEFCY
ncbi:unnamed protein product [Brachionus calyciflorus]|uniref:Uncharacterized protein n=1 Tax=Brachionus calyciflorus TaxID=104777 RepID=A0A814MA57_9BILA|nr:unnamed protein product [Brachionus calyciflorus]